MMRTNYCAELGEKHLGKEIIVCGWVHSWRDHGGVLFIDVRDRSGIIQAVIAPENKEAFAIAETLRGEYVVKICGELKKRPQGYTNPNMPTGEYEIAVKEITLLNPAKTLPFEIGEHSTANEDTRLKYRYLDLRNPKMFQNLLVRHRLALAVRKFFDKKDFIEIETPVLTRSTPEGARDYLVPSRTYPGKFYALPQSPQMFKQILMMAGVDKYFQLARAFRDEDLRADRQPEHTQIDVEMSFVQEADIFKLMEEMLVEVFTAAGEKIEIPFPQFEYTDVLNKYGSDKPDVRYGMEIADASEIFSKTGFKVFAEILKDGGAIKAVKCEGGAQFSRGEMDKLTEFAKANGAKGLVWLKVKDGGVESPSAKFFSEQEIAALLKLTQAKDGDALFLGSDKPAKALLFMGALRKELIAKTNPAPSKKWAFLWVKHFPLLEWNADEQRYDATHNPFTAPMEEEIPKLDSDPGNIRSHQYDLVLNGVELASGSIRNHKRALQEKSLALMKHSPEQQ
ncbi:MAG: aspartate--tRNA ligase, partial [Elusimicrobia bacterium]|nr:aspartate--tRNA ligase [Elusimicrobiota bacterium]